MLGSNHCENAVSYSGEEALVVVLNRAFSSALYTWMPECGQHCHVCGVSQAAHLVLMGRMIWQGTTKYGCELSNMWLLLSYPLVAMYGLVYCCKDVNSVCRQRETEVQAWMESASQSDRGFEEAQAKSNHVGFVPLP